MRKEGVTEMAKKNTDDLGVLWYLPGKKRRFATTTASSSLLIGLLGEDGHTFGSALDVILYDPEAKTVVQYFVENGYADAKISEHVRS